MNKDVEIAIDHGCPTQEELMKGVDAPEPYAMEASWKHDHGERTIRCRQIGYPIFTSSDSELLRARETLVKVHVVNEKIMIGDYLFDLKTIDTLVGLIQKANSLIHESRAKRDALAAMQ